MKLVFNMLYSLNKIQFILKSSSYQYQQLLGSIIKLNVSPKPIEDFQKTSYSLNVNGNIISEYDELVRKSLDTRCEQPIFNDEVIPVLNSYLSEIGESVGRIDEQWRLLKYVDGGHFIEHADRIRSKEGYIHFGTQILLPPKQVSDYEGGILSIKQGDKHHEIRPVSNFWTHVVIPLGVYHSVSSVKGTRISYVKQVYINQKSGKTYNFPICYELETKSETEGGKLNPPKPNPQPQPIQPKPKD